jgi:hypothetical protein
MQRSLRFASRIDALADDGVEQRRFAVAYPKTTKSKTDSIFHLLTLHN